ncbi:MAG: TatD family hydrolase [Patescibacteria group bacterium]
MLFDSHSHLQFKIFFDKPEVVKKCLEKNMLVNLVGTNYDTSKKAVDLAEKYENFYASIGLHPIHLFAEKIDEEESSFISHEEDFIETNYQELLKTNKVIAIGECGIDLYHLPQNISKDKVLAKQKEILLKQVEFALANNLPMVLHVRDGKEETGEAYDILYNVLKKYKNLKAVVHCFSGNYFQAKKFLDLGFYLGFTGIITFPAKKTDPKPQKELLEVLEKIDLNKILIETDSPYLAPQKYRGQICEPWMVEETLNFIAEKRKITVKELEEILDQNRLKLFTKIKN